MEDDNVISPIWIMETNTEVIIRVEAIIKDLPSGFKLRFGDDQIVFLAKDAPAGSTRLTVRRWAANE